MPETSSLLIAGKIKLPLRGKYNVQIKMVIIILYTFFLTACTDASSEKTLMRAAAQGNLANVKQIMQQNPKLLNHNAMNEALKNSIVNSHPELVAFFLQTGANANSTDQLGNTPLIIAAAIGDINMIQLLFQNNATIDKPNDKGVTPLIAAAGAQKFAAMSWLLAYGGNPCIKDKDARNAFQTAVYWNGTEVSSIIKGNKTLSRIICANDQNI